MKSSINPILVALDLPGADEAIRLAEALRGLVGGFKIGSELFNSAGPGIVRDIRNRGGAVFLDLKFHDIPNTVAKAVQAAVRLDVQLLTVHSSGGTEMMRAAESSAQETARQLGIRAPLVLGVTVLTSLDSTGLTEVGVHGNIAGQVERLAALAWKAGLRGLVCSPLEVAGLRQFLPREFQLVTPGIRSATEAATDQKRTLSAAEALAAGANYVVIGRPIYAAPDPRLAVAKILEQI